MTNEQFNQILNRRIKKIGKMEYDVQFDVMNFTSSKAIMDIIVAAQTQGVIFIDSIHSIDVLIENAIEVLLNVELHCVLECHDTGIGPFESLIVARVQKIQVTLLQKSKEYSTDTDRLHNFNVAAEIGMMSPELAWLGMWLKHIVSIQDMILGGLAITQEMIDEKIGDAINYLILFEGLLRQRNGK